MSALSASFMLVLLGITFVVTSAICRICVKRNRKPSYFISVACVFIGIVAMHLIVREAGLKPNPLDEVPAHIWLLLFILFCLPISIAPAFGVVWFYRQKIKP
jgi:hypothetical protein